MSLCLTLCRIWVVRLLPGVLALATASPGFAQPTATTVSRDRAAVLQQLERCGATTDSVLSGQNAGHADHQPRLGYQRFLAALQADGGQVPALLSMDYGYNGTGFNLHEANAVLIDHWRGGGLAMVSMHPPNPWNRSDAHDLATGDFDDLFRPQTAVHAVWRAELRRVARGLAELKAAGVTVLWRPFHEMNGGWFWWGSHQQGTGLSPQQFQRLWQDTYRYLTIEQDLDHLLWVYAPTVSDGPQRQPADHYYPGDDWVDLTALDWYTDHPRWQDIQSSYAQLARLGKPIGIAEFGPAAGPFDNRRFLEFLKQSPQPWAFFSYWHSWEDTDVAIVDHPHAAELLLDPMVINRRDLKNQAMPNQLKP